MNTQLYMSSPPFETSFIPFPSATGGAQPMLLVILIPELDASTATTLSKTAIAEDEEEPTWEDAECL